MHLGFLALFPPLLLHPLNVRNSLLRTQSCASGSRLLRLGAGLHVFWPVKHGWLEWSDAPLNWEGHLTPVMLGGVSQLVTVWWLFKTASHSWYLCEYTNDGQFSAPVDTNILRSNTRGHISLETWEASFMHLYNPRNSDVLIPLHWWLSSYPLWKCVVIKLSAIPSLEADFVSWCPSGIYNGFATTSRKKNSQQHFLHLCLYVNAYMLRLYVFLSLFVSVNWKPHIFLNQFYQCGIIMWFQSVNELLRNGERPPVTSKTDT